MRLSCAMLHHLDKRPHRLHDLLNISTETRQRVISELY
eukprot:SAG31_NODE_46861_length_252_cov_1.346405_2_plen_37_part_01